ncbi:MAG: phosphatase PAP2 family protein, partial [Chloroflexota bacterium]|nr:phosphatase PAP2 family protein [Chloroflexota bacterium]
LYTVSDMERWQFNGSLPSTVFQRVAFDPGRIQPHDIALAIVHGSFFVVPFLIAAFAWSRHRPSFSQYMLATATCFALSLVAFILLPTAPPWMSDPDDVTRITYHILRGSGLDASTSGTTVSSAAFWFEPNDTAALPSVHVAMAVLVFLVLTGIARWGRSIGGLYALAMSVSVVYLGEHFVLDVITGWLVALAAWRLTRPRH